MRDIKSINAGDDIFSEVLFCKQIMVSNRRRLGLSIPGSEDINALLQEIYKMAARLRSEYGIKMLLEDIYADGNPEA